MEKKLAILGFVCLSTCASANDVILNSVPVEPTRCTPPLMSAGQQPCVRVRHLINGEVIDRYENPNAIHAHPQYQHRWYHFFYNEEEPRGRDSPMASQMHVSPRKR